MSGRLEEGEVTSGNNHGICERTKIFEFPEDSVIPTKGGKLPGIAHADCCLSRKTAIGQKGTIGDLQARQRILCPLTVIHRSSYPGVAHRLRNLMTALANSSG